MNISVCMATYNGEEFVIRQLESVVKQLKQSDEIIIVDDGSTDRTIEVILEKFGDVVTLIQNSSNLGVIRSFEKAIEASTGDVIFLCDQDDIWENDKVEKVLKAFSTYDSQLIVHDASMVDRDLNLIHPSWNRYNQNKQKSLLGNVIKNSFTGCCMAFSKRVKEDILPFPKHIEMHDQWIALTAMIKKRRIDYIDLPLIKYVRHGGNVTGTKKRTYLQMLQGRMGIIYSLIHYKISK